MNQQEMIDRVTALTMAMFVTASDELDRVADQRDTITIFMMAVCLMLRQHDELYPGFRVREFIRDQITRELDGQ